MRLRTFCHSLSISLTDYLTHKPTQTQNRYLAFGSVLIDKTKAAMEKATSQILPHMVNTIEKDPHELVKDTACWALGVIMQRYGGMLPKPARDACVRVLIGALTLKPSIANNAAYGIHNLGT